ncbi:MAG: hypothetical protein ACYDAK_03450 [Candidatus Limnocylindrales bacterium]
MTRDQRPPARGTPPRDDRAPLRYLSTSEVVASLPPLEEQLELAELTLRALVADAELPAKIGVHPRFAGSFGHAMPAYLRGEAVDGSVDGLGMKWVTGFGTNTARGLPAIHAIIVLNDPTTGAPVGILDGASITAARTAAVSGVAIRNFAPRVSGRPIRAAVVGAGVQGRSHVPMLGHVLSGVDLAIHDRHPERARALVETARTTAGIGWARAMATARDAIADADVVVTVASFGPVRQVLTNDWLRPHALVIAVDYATYLAAEVAAGAALFLVDERGQFLATRAAGDFAGYPDPTATIGEALVAGTARPDGRVVVTHLGVGLADVVFGRAILAAAEAAGRGMPLAR